MTYEDFLGQEPFAVPQAVKDEMLVQGLRRLSHFHMENCKQYRQIAEAFSFEPDRAEKVSDFMFLPARLFKEIDLCSVPEEEIFKTMTSSGTSGQRVSKIFLDKETAARQQKTLVRIVSSFTGTSRLPMLIIDCPSVVRNRQMFSARGAGILGFSIFGRKPIYALDDNMDLRLQAIREFMAEHKDEKLLLFGFTFMIWQHFYKALRDSGERLELQNAILIHGGGWKKLLQETVSPQDFNKAMREVAGIKRVIDYYGMVEQTGCVYMECEHGHLHASTYSDVLIHRAKDFSEADIGEEGIIEVVSLLPKSYPGHAILTEDAGKILGIDDCPCGRQGKYFEVFGRLKNAEIRGCSDTYAL